MNHIKKWNKWRKYSLNSRLYKLMVLLKIVISPTLEYGGAE